MNPSRRSALVVVAGMSAAAGLAAFGKPRLRVRDGASPVDLDRMFPSSFERWRVDGAAQAFVRPAARQGARYGIYDQVLERTFVNEVGQRVMLSVAFGSEQSANLQLHRPEHCYRASGFEVRGTHAEILTIGDRRIPITRLQADLPGRPECITYWTVLGGAVVADEASFNWRRLAFAAKRELLDGFLVRVSSIDSDANRAYLLHFQFSDALRRALSPSDRDKFIGYASAG